MANVPWHQEVVSFVQQLADMLPQYEIACEHEHSNCLLIAHTKVGGARRVVSELSALPVWMLGQKSQKYVENVEYHKHIFLL